MVSARVRRKQVAYVRARGISLRRACALLKVARSTMGYESRVAKRDAPVVEAMQELAGQYPRFGYRRIQVFLARQGHAMSADRAYRLWKEGGSSSAAQATQEARCNEATSPLSVDRRQPGLGV
jgi:putative transposase